MTKVTKTAVSQAERFAELYFEMNGIYYKIYRRDKLNRREVELLYHIRMAKGTITQRDLCDLTGLPKQTINSAVSALTKKGIVELKETPEGGRLRHIEMTQKGWQFAHDHIDVITLCEQQAFADMGAEEVKKLLELIEQFNEKLATAAKV